MQDPKLEDRKAELIKFFVRALSCFAELILIECGLTNNGYNKFYLVADVLFHEFMHFSCYVYKLCIQFIQYVYILQWIHNGTLTDFTCLPVY